MQSQVCISGKCFLETNGYSNAKYLPIGTWLFYIGCGTPFTPRMIIIMITITIIGNARYWIFADILADSWCRYRYISFFGEQQVSLSCAKIINITFVAFLFVDLTFVDGLKQKSTLYLSFHNKKKYFTHEQIRKVSFTSYIFIHVNYSFWPLNPIKGQGGCCCCCTPCRLLTITHKHSQIKWVIQSNLIPIQTKDCFKNDHTADVILSLAAPWVYSSYWQGMSA